MSRRVVVSSDPHVPLTIASELDDSGIVLSELTEATLEHSPSASPTADAAPSSVVASQKRCRRPASFHCPVPGCERTFTRHFYLKAHLREHLGQNPFQCTRPGCGQDFARQDEYLQHKSTHLNI